MASATAPCSVLLAARHDVQVLKDYQVDAHINGIGGAKHVLTVHLSEAKALFRTDETESNLRLEHDV